MNSDNTLPAQIVDDAIDRAIGGSLEEHTPEPVANTGSSEDEAGAEQKSGPHGQFVADTGKVRLADGSVITVGELKRGNLRQADYTRKAQELAASRRDLQARHLELSHQIQSLNQAIAIVTQVAGAIPPDRLQRLTAHLQSAAAAALAEESALLFEKLPELKDKKRAAEFRDEAKTAVEQYGFDGAELEDLRDHRVLVLLRDVVAYRKLLDAKPTAMAKLEGKPALTPGKRQSPAAAQHRSKHADWMRVRQSRGQDHQALDRIIDTLI